METLRIVLVVMNLAALGVTVLVIVKEKRARLPAIMVLLWVLNSLLFQLVAVAQQEGLLDLPIPALNLWSTLVRAQILATITAIGLAIVWNYKND